MTRDCEILRLCVVGFLPEKILILIIFYKKKINILRTDLLVLSNEWREMGNSGFRLGIFFWGGYPNFYCYANFVLFCTKFYGAK